MKTDSRAAQTIMSTAESIPIRFISEALASFDKQTPYADVVTSMKASNFDVVGVTDRAGRVIGYVDAKSKLNGVSGDRDHLHSLDPGSLVTDAMPLAEAGALVARRRRVFVLEGNRVTSIVTRADLQKAPVRMMLFGVITVLEMHLTDALRREWPDETWKTCASFTPKRVRAIESAFRQATVRNDETDVFGCMDMYDKSLLASETASLSEILHIEGADDLESSELGDIRRLRNAVAHGKSLVTSNRSWNKVLRLVIAAQQMAEALESMLGNGT